MISDIRRELQKTYKPFLWFAAFAMAFSMSIPAIFKLIWSAEPWVVRVNNETISTKQLMHAIRQKEELIAQVKAQYGEYANYLLHYLGLGNDPQTMAMDSLVREAVINQLSSTMGIQIHEDFVKEMLRKKEFVSKELTSFVPPHVLDIAGLLDQRRLVDFLSRQKMSVEWFDKQVEQLLARRMAIDLIGIAHYTPRVEIAEELASGYMTRQFSIITMPFADVLKSEQAKEATSDELHAFFEQENRTDKRYLVPEKRAGNVYVFDPASFHITITEQEAEQYYQDQKEQLFVASPIQMQVRLLLIKDNEPSAAEKINALKETLTQQPEQFATLAKTESHDETSAAEGGLLPFFAKGSQDPIIERAAFGLKQDGDISPVLYTKQGYVLIQRVARKAKEYLSFAQANEQVIASLEKQKFKKLFAQEVKTALESGESIEKALVALAAQRGGRPQAVALKERDTSKLMTTLFKLKKGESSFYFEKDEGHVVLLTDVQEHYLPSFEQLEATIKIDFYTDKAHKALETILVSMREDAKQMSLDAIVTKYGASFEKTDFISATQASTFEKRDIPIQSMMQMNKVGTVLSRATEQAGYFVRLDAVESMLNDEAKDLDKKEKEVTRRLTANRKQQFIDGFIASLCRNATIETNNYMTTVAEESML